MRGPEGVPEGERIINVSTFQDLERFLEANKLPTQSWGINATRKPQELFVEIVNGESFLSQSETAIFRNVLSVGVDVWHVSSTGQAYNLVEVDQVFDIGTENESRRVRVKQHGAAVTEKARRGEIPIQVAIRALREELGIDPGDSLMPLGTETEEHASTSFPGIMTRDTKDFYRVDLSPEQFDPNGYIDQEERVTTTFRWIIPAEESVQS